ncbi:MAG: T9SS type A sorting domain-containing protein [Bacteroidetes bacterium]|nr:T9SS type A sorting domain-containing protein [Bacteroidota bacterium]
MNNNQNYLTPDGDFGVSNNAKILLYAPDFSLLPGTDFGGGEVDVVISKYDCMPDEYRKANNGGVKKGGNNVTGTELENTLTTATNLVHTSKAGVKVYPNPSNGKINIERESEDMLLITIYDLSGEQVYNGIINGAGSNSIDISTLQSGIYLLRAGNENFKLIITKE